MNTKRTCLVCTKTVAKSESLHRHRKTKAHRHRLSLFIERMNRVLNKDLLRHIGTFLQKDRHRQVMDLCIAELTISNFFYSRCHRCRTPFGYFYGATCPECQLEAQMR